MFLKKSRDLFYRYDHAVKNKPDNQRGKAWFSFHQKYRCFQISDNILCMRYNFINYLIYFQVGVTMLYHLLVAFGNFQIKNPGLQFFVECLLSQMPLLLSSIASTLHLIAIAIDRFISVKFPIQHKVRFDKR